MAENDHSTDTRMAQRQTGRLQRTLGRFDIVFLIFSAVVGLEMLGSVSAEGPQTFTWLVFLIALFLVPYALVFAETGSAFPGEGGVYLWSRRAFGRPVAAVASALSQLFGLFLVQYLADKCAAAHCT